MTIDAEKLAEILKANRDRKLTATESFHRQRRGIRQEAEAPALERVRILPEVLAELERQKKK